MMMETWQGLMMTLGLLQRLWLSLKLGRPGGSAEDHFLIRPAIFASHLQHIVPDMYYQGSLLHIRFIKTSFFLSWERILDGSDDYVRCNVSLHWRQAKH
jgi:hypothetical protein